jgi:xanthine/uracil permease
MSVGIALQHSYEFTCDICTKLRSLLVAVLVTIISISESAGRARAASELSRMGYHKEAKALMLGKEIDYEEISK